MRIVIDIQACQTTGSRNRGIGRYSLALMKAMLANSGGHDFHILLNGLFHETIEPMRQIFSELMPMDNIHVWGAPGPVSETHKGNFWRCRSAEFLREQSIANLRPDLVHVTSLFEGSGDNAVTSISQNGEYVSTAVTLYDLIPFIYKKQYLKEEQQRNWYFRKLASLHKADLLLAISESSRMEAIEYLNFSPDRVFNISSAVDAHFVCADRLDTELLVQKKFGIHKSYVMYTGGIDLRKNIDRLVQAFAHLPPQVRNQYQLVVVCSVQSNDRIRLSELAKQCGLQPNDLILTGFVNDQELVSLYQQCTVFVFPSWHEGFGLPALEAMSCGVPVIAANTSSLPEVVGRADVLFDPFYIDSITSKLNEVLTNHSYREDLIRHSSIQAKKFSWEQSAKRTVEAFEKQFAMRREQRFFNISAVVRPKLAYFSPLPKLATGIAIFSAQLLPQLSRYYDIDLIVEQEQVNDDWLSANFRVRDVTWFMKHASEYERIIYNVGNSSYHAYMMDALVQFSGVVILHDFYLNGLYSFIHQNNPLKNIFNKNLFQSHSYPALIAAKKTSEYRQAIWDFPVNLDVLNHANGVIVHSDFAIQLAKDWYGERMAQLFNKIPHFHFLPKSKNVASARAALGIQSDTFLVCSFGFLGEIKLNKLMLNAWNNSALSNDENAQLIFVGQTDGSPYCNELLEMINESGAKKNIKVTGYVDDQMFSQYLAATDVAVQLRGNTRGEASFTVLDCLANGIPTIVNNHGAIKELPANGLIKLPEIFSQEELARNLIQLRDDPPLRLNLGESGINYVKQFCNIEEIAEKYFISIENFFKNGTKSRLKRTLRHIADIDVEEMPTEHDLVRLAQNLAVNQMIDSDCRVLLDISQFERLDFIKDVQLRQLLAGFLILIYKHLPRNIRVEPVIIRLNKGGAVVYTARELSSELLDLTDFGLQDEILSPWSNDLLIQLDISLDTNISNSGRGNYSDLMMINQRKIDVCSGVDGSGILKMTVQDLFEIFYKLLFKEKMFFEMPSK